MNIHAPVVSWTADRVTDLITHHAAGLSAAQIAKRLGYITRNAVIGKIHRLGMNLTHMLTPEEKAERFARMATVKRLRQERQNLRRRLAREANPQAPRPPRSQTLREIYGLPQADVLQAQSKNVPFLELENHHCRFPYGSGPYLFCGNDKIDNSTYCAGHHVLCWTPPRQRAVRA